jgi:hypothetical protein
MQASPVRRKLGESRTRHSSNAKWRRDADVAGDTALGADNYLVRERDPEWISAIDNALGE